MRTRTVVALISLLTLTLALLLPACAGKATPSPTPTLAPTSTPAPTATRVPPTPTPFHTRSPLITPESGTRTPMSVQCQSTPQWGLGDVWNIVKDSVGCPTGDQAGFHGQKVSFQSGFVIWRGDLKVLYVLYYTGEPRVEVYRDTYSPGETPAAPLPTPTGEALGQLIAAPTGPFGKLWREVEGVRERLGWCVTANAAQGCTAEEFEGIAQDCEKGTLLWDRQSAFAIHFSDMLWDMY